MVPNSPTMWSLFLQGGTLQALGLSGLSSKSGQLTAAVPREKLLADIQFQGAISDFHCLKDALKAADYDDVLLRANDDDAFGDGNNFEVAVTKAAAAAWQQADAAAAEAAVAAAAAAQAASDEAVLPRAKQRRRGRQAWQDLGTEVGLLLSRPRRGCGAPLALSDAPAAELWASNAMEARPFKDANYDLRSAEAAGGGSAGARRTVWLQRQLWRLRHASTRATGGRPRPGSVQTAAQQLPVEHLEQLLGSQGFAGFLESVIPRLDEALLQNAVADVLTDDLELLADEEGEGLAGSSSSGPNGGSRAAGGGGGGRQEHVLTEAQSFTDLTYSKNKVVSAICWVPNRKGVVACACTDPASQTERLASMGRLSPAYILIWNFRDPIHPEYVLESPHEVFCFQYNPANPDIVVGGCYNGQLIVWDTAGLESGRHGVGAAGGAAAGGGRGGVAGSASGAAGWEDSAGEEAATPVIRHKYMSSVEHSHTSAVADVCWLPGIEVDRTGKMFPIRANSAGTSAQSLLRSGTLGAAALASQAAGSSVPRDCCFFASIAPDGKVLFWDVRVDKLLKKGSKRVDDAELVWKPMHSVHLLSVAGNDFAGCRFCFDPFRLDSGNFTAGSMDGELLTGNLIRPPGEDNPDYTRCVFAPHAGLLVALCASPFLPDLLLSVGDWTFRLWQGVESQVPVFTSPYAEEAYTAAAWSPSRPGLLFLATCAGSLHVWDLLDRSHEPSLRISTTSCAITSIAFSNALPKHATHSSAPLRASDAGPAVEAASTGRVSGASLAHAGQQQQQQQRHAVAGAGLQVLAVGDAYGVLHLFELPRTLRRPLQSEHKLMAGFVAREAARVADVAARQPLRAAAQKQLEESRKAADDGQAADQHSAAAPDAATLKDVLQASSAAARVSAISSSQAGTLAGAAGDVLHGAVAGPRPGSEASDRSASAVAAAAAAAAEREWEKQLEREEKRYKELEAQFKEQLGLAA
ncbi:WD40-repeat-containing domain protein [Scenedesmus sp. NREL 46B-D3]|nr:WD40-repeat-containing domain protein [Scenedesmus sp. NREL 46B-D3]